MQSNISSQRDSTAEKQPPRTVDSPAHIALLLKRLMDAQRPLTVASTESHGVRQFFITSINSTQHTLEMHSADHTHSRGPTETEAMPANLHLTSQVDGVFLSFSAELIKRGRNADKNYTTLAFPKALLSTQQRENYRILPRMMKRPAIQLDGPTGSTRGEITNVSMGGALALLPNNRDSEEVLTSNADGQLVMCAITFDEDPTVVTSARVCHHHRHPATGEIIAGLTFLPLDRETRLQLQRHTSRLERENARWR